MKIVEGNSYVCIKECKDVKGKTINVGTICYGNKRWLLCGYNNEKIYSQVEPLEDYDEYFTLYEESPYNKECRELREKYAGMMLQGIISTSEMSILKHKEEAVKEAVEFADVLVAELRGDK